MANHLNRYKIGIFYAYFVKEAAMKRNTPEKFKLPNCIDKFPVELHKELLMRTFMESPLGYVIVPFQEEGSPITFVNTAFEEITGYQASEVLGRSCGFLLNGDLDQEALVEFGGAIRSNEPTTRVVRNYRKDGSLFYNELSVYPLLGESGEITYLIWTQNDITSTNKHKESYGAYSQHSNEAIWRLDFNPPISVNIPVTDQVQEFIERGVFGEVNDKAAQIYGYKEGIEVVGRPLKEFLQGEDQKNINMITKLVRRNFTMDRVVVTEKTAEGNQLVSLNNVMPTVTEEGVCHLWGASLDVTELFDTKQKLQLSKDQLAAQKKTLEKKNIALNELIAHMEFEKKDAMDKIVSYVSEVALPSLEKIRLNKGKDFYIDLHRRVLEDLASPYAQKIDKIRSVLTPREMEVCNLVKNGYTNKEISRLLGITRQTVEKHRRMARKKLGITNKKINLHSYLNSL